jgi:hypothetical protein
MTAEVNAEMTVGAMRANEPALVRITPSRMLFVLLALAGALGGGACSKDSVAVSGSCIVEQNPALGCDGPVGGASGHTLGLVGYSCTGAARPDDSPTYAEGIPQGVVCADRPALAGAPAETRNYCCTAATSDCAFNPAAICDSSTFGFQCRGANRPESLNPQLTCGQGVRQADYINYCCSGTPQPDGCLQSDSISCSPQLMGFSCMSGHLPKAEQLGASKSRADYYYMLCATPTPAANPQYSNYCCFAPALVPDGGSCVQHTAVPGCQPGRFGFACYGRDTPEEDYLPMRCPQAGVPGLSAQGYPATLYCCDFAAPPP